jgi:broad specificity phosphatase PhoE
VDLYFIRHGQGEHTLNLPESLQIADASLTELGKQQAMDLNRIFPLSEDDIIIVSPVRRALETVEIWNKDIHCKKYVHPFVGPRMFPLLNASEAFTCDRLLTCDTIINQFPQFLIVEGMSPIIWKAGINCISEIDFLLLSRQFIDWCRTLQKQRLFIVSHDGTITSYRVAINNEVLTRKDFLGEAGWYIMTVNQ